MNISLTKIMERRRFNAKYGLHQAVERDYESISWRVLYVVAGVFWAVFVADLLYAKFTKPQPAAKMTQTLEVRK